MLNSFRYLLSMFASATVLKVLLVGKSEVRILNDPSALYAERVGRRKKELNTGFPNAPPFNGVCWRTKPPSIFRFILNLSETLFVIRIAPLYLLRSVAKTVPIWLK